MNVDALGCLLKRVIKSKYGTAQNFFHVARGNSGLIGKKDWKAALQNLSFHLTDGQRKELRKRISGGNKNITLRALSTFMGEAVASQKQKSAFFCEKCAGRARPSY